MIRTAVLFALVVSLAIVCLRPQDGFEWSIVLLGGALIGLLIDALIIYVEDRL